LQYYHKEAREIQFLDFSLNSLYCKIRLLYYSIIFD